SSNSESEITNADRIALNPSSSIENEFASLKEEQEKDEDIQWIKGLILENGVQKPKISIFESPTRRILYKQYDHFTFVDDDIMRCVKCCDVCQKIKLTQPARHAELIYLTPCRPNQLITTDLAGPFPVTQRGNKYLQVIVDHLTKLIQIHALNSMNEHGEVIVLEDYDDIVEKNLPAVATNYLQELKMKLKKCYQMATKNRNCRMDKAKLDHDRKIKKFEYNIGDYENNCDYLIKLASSPRSKVRQVYKNRLKYYFHSGHSLPTKKEKPVEQPDRQKRKYTKNLNNPRWKPIENHNEPEHNVTDTSITQPMSTGNVSSSDSDSDV
ncbi:retrovirus-related pol poly from transposon, partial [Brachionus plicatilis]